MDVKWGSLSFRFVALTGVCVGALAALGCRSPSTGTTAAGASSKLPATPTKSHIDPIAVLSEQCGGCHRPDSEIVDLDLTSDNVASRLVNKPSENCDGFILADPSNPEQSLLYLKLTDEPGCGSTMPPEGMPRPTPEEIVAIRDWISGLSVAAAGSCTPRETRACDGGNPEWWSVCEQPTQSCSADGDRWGDCTGALPGIENCTTDADDDCNPDTPANRCSDKQWAFSVARERDQQFESVGVDNRGNVYVLGSYQGVANFGTGDIASDEPGGQYKDNVFLGKYDKFGTPLWVKNFGDSSSQYGARMAVNPTTGDVAIVVRLFGGVMFGDGSPSYMQIGSGDIVVAVLDQDGNHRWSRHLGGRAKDRAERVAWALDNGDVIITGKVGASRDKQLDVPGKGPIEPQGDADALVVRFGPTGDVRWSAVLGGDTLIEGDEAVKAAGGECNPGDGSVYRRCRGCGAQHCDPKTRTWSECGVRQNNDGTNMFACARTDLVCSQEKSTYGLCVSGDDDYAWGGVTDKNGDVYVTGRFEGHMKFPKFGGGNKTVEVSSLGSLDVFVVKLDGATGSPIWSKRFGGPGDDRAYDIALQRGSGKLIVTGYFTGTVDFGGTKLVAKGGGADDDIFVMSLNPGNGSTAWAKGYGDNTSQFGHAHESGKTTRQTSLEIDEKDNIWVGGSLYGSFDGKIRAHGPKEGKMRPDAFFVKLSPSGAYLNGRVYGGSTAEFCADFALDPTTNTILMAGHMYSSSLNFGTAGKVMGISSAADAWLAKVSRP